MKTRLLIFLALLVVAVTTPAQADYPTKPIELIAPYPAGGPADVLARILAQAAGPHLGQSVVVVNKPGGGGTVGTAFAARAKADGYTVLVAAIPPTVIQPHLVKVPYTSQDFVPVAQLSSRTLVLSVKASAPFKKLSDLLDQARREPGKLVYTTTQGTVPHLVGADLFKRAGVQLTLVPQAGDAPALTMVLGGNADAVISSRVSALPHVQASTLRPLVVFNEARDPILSDVPTARESGFDVVGNPWTGVALAKGTPEEIVKRWEDLLAKLARDPAFIEALKKVGEDVVYLGRAEFGKRWFAEPEIYGRIVRELGLKPQ